MSDTVSREKVLEIIKFYEGSSFPENAFPAMIESIKKIPSESRWIPCSEQAPTTSDEYLITWTCEWNGKLIRSISIAEYDAEAEEWNTDAYIRNYSNELGIIAWMPLPECYRGENDG